ncbi:hypothetical protein HG537_0B00490 [Torulaspora globosa]|uniref:protein disulfide-isomerase n=1 Tax=Torulaspora globosa TaxID=48254 RepID=A0A7H9HN12_9SACH|nr:hypothetical protein HG537_0B00490 [Torulaspora sp. CBS 2947]
MLLNKKTVLQFATLLVSALGVTAQEGAVAPEDSAVVKLTSEGFEDFIKENPLALVEFFAPWCGHCKTLGPQFVKAADVLQEKGIPLAQVDCTEQQELCMAQGIRGYPSLKTFKDHDVENPKDYEGARSAEAIINYMLKQTLPVVQVFDAEEPLKEFLANATLPVIISNGAAALNETFYQTANKYSDEYSFVTYPGSKSELSLQLPGVSEPIVYNGDVKKIEGSPEVLENWLKVEALPYFGEVNGDTFAAYMESGLPLAYFFYTNEDELKEFTPFFTELAKQHRGKLNFAGLDSRKFGRHAESLNMRQQFPLFAIHNITSNLKYGLPQLAEEEFDKLTDAVSLETKHIKKLVNDLLSGKAEPIVKSEDIPEVQESNVYKIVGKTHDDLVKNNKKDVLVKYYAPWCGHCKRLAPIYEELADILAAEKDFIIGEVDATLNDIQDVAIEGYPTIILYPAGKNAEPIVFNAQRDLDSFLAFIEENAGNKIDTKSVREAYEKEQAKKDEAEVKDESTEHDEL